MAMRATKIQSVKAEAIVDLKNKIGDAKDFIFTEYRGLTVEQISALRKQLREKNAEFHVVKNNFARIAFEDLGYTEGSRARPRGPDRRRLRQGRRPTRSPRSSSTSPRRCRRSRSRRVSWTRAS